MLRMNVSLQVTWMVAYLFILEDTIFFLYGIDGISKYRAGPTRHEKLKTCVLLEVIIVRW